MGELDEWEKGEKTAKDNEDGPLIDVRPEKMGVSPEVGAGFLSRLLFLWFTPLPTIGAERALTEDDVFPLRDDVRSENLNEEFRQRNSKGKPVTLISSFFIMFKKEVVMVFLLRLVTDLLRFMNPVLLRRVLDAASDGAPLTVGLTWAVAMFACAEARSLVVNKYAFITFIVTGKLKSILINLIYRKSLALSSRSSAEFSSGRVANLMSVDVMNIIPAVPVIIHLWATPFQVTLSLVYLAKTLGAASMMAFIVIIVYIPFNLFTSRYVKRWQEQSMHLKDERVKLCAEMLNAMKVVKLYAWETAMHQRIAGLRKKEVRVLLKIQAMNRTINLINSATPFIVAILTFGYYVLDSTENVLTPQVAFVSLTLFNQLRTPMNVISVVINRLTQSYVAKCRLEAFLNCEERESGMRAPPEGEAVRMEGVTAGWRGEQSVLHSVSLTLPRGGLVAVVGGVGSGKSSLLAAVMGEMHVSSGRVAALPASFSPQLAWLVNDSVKENILFGLPSSPLYYRVVEACALSADIAAMPAGDGMLVGDNGCLLSGGQRARVCLARAVYAALWSEKEEEKMVLLDDPLAALDASVATWIQDKVLSPSGLLSAHTRVLATNNLRLARGADTVVVMREGRVAECGPPSELLEREEGVFRTMLNEREKKDGAATQESASCQTPTSEKTMKQKKEHLETGGVSYKAYFAYFKAAGVPFVLAFIAFLILNTIMHTARGKYLAHWTNQDRANKHMNTVITRLEIYGGLGTAEVLCLAVSSVFAVLAATRASRRIHDPVLDKLTRAKIQVFGATPVGRILNRLSSDLNSVDGHIPANMRQFAFNFLQVLLTFYMICSTSVTFVFFAVPLIYLYCFLTKYIAPTPRQLMRLEAASKSHLYSRFSEAAGGIAVIRAHNRVSSFRASFCHLVDDVVKYRLNCWIANRWLDVRIEFIASLVVLSAAVIGVCCAKWYGVSTGYLGLSLTYALGFTELINSSLKHATEIEAHVVAVERLRELEQLEEEGAWTLEGDQQDWPKQGKIEWQSYSARHSHDTPVVLDSIDLTVEPGQRVAVFGRTGSGKSSLSLSLFRLVDCCGGRLLIDGVDIATLGLHHLRERISVIPQDPVLFSGTLRANIDPFDKYDDEKMWSALRACQLDTLVKEKGLETEIAEGGANLSAGERQLVCVCRAALRHSRIVVLDEATASVDAVTESRIGRAMSSLCADGATLISIAHKTSAAEGVDRVVVLDSGRVLECGRPSDLLEQDSHYRRIVQAAQ